MNEPLTVRDVIQYIRDAQNAHSKLQQGFDRDNGTIIIDASTAKDIECILTKFQDILNNGTVLFN